METLEHIHSRILGIGPANNDQSLCYAGSGTAPLLPVLEEATSEVATRVLVFILTVNND